MPREQTSSEDQSICAPTMVDEPESPEVLALRNLIQRLKDGDEDAAAELVKKYELAIRCTIRVKLCGRQIRRLFDSGDFLQSTLCRFFAGVRAGNIQLEDPTKLTGLLCTIARNCVRDEIRRKQRADKYMDMLDSSDVDLGEVCQDPNPGPSELVEVMNDAEVVRTRTPDTIWRLVVLRLNNLTWAEIAKILDGDPDALRMRYKRWIDWLKARFEGER